VTTIVLYRVYLAHSSGRRDHCRVVAQRWWRRCSRRPFGGGPGCGEDTRGTYSVGGGQVFGGEGEGQLIVG